MKQRDVLNLEKRIYLNQNFEMLRKKKEEEKEKKKKCKQIIQQNLNFHKVIHHYHLKHNVVERKEIRKLFNKHYYLEY